MKKKVIIAATALMLATTSVVSAAAVWGKYKGFDIVRVQVDGKNIESNGTPALSLDGRTMIPINMLQSAGVGYEFDSKNRTIKISSQSQGSDKKFAQYYKELSKKILPVENFQIITDELGTFINIETSLSDTADSTAYYILPAYIGGSYNKDFDFVNLNIVYNKQVLMSVTVDYDTSKLYFSNKIDIAELIKKSTLKNYTNNSSVLPAPSNNISNKYPELYSNDLKTYLGKLSTNNFDTESIFNEYGTYGSKYNAKSIWNEFGTYGGEYSNQSPFNKYANKPPAIVQNGKVVGYLTLNPTIKNAISPAGLIKWLEDNGY